MHFAELPFEMVHDSFRPKVQRYLTRLVGEQESEDLTQQVFVRVSRALPTVRGESQLTAWIYRIATNAATDRMRAASFRENAQQSPLDDSVEIEHKESWTGKEMPSPDEQVWQPERSERFQGFLGRLSADNRTAFVPSDLQELPNNEIAEILGLSLDTVKIRLHRARAKLFQELKGHCKAEDWL